MEEIRCNKCNKMLYKVDNAKPYWVEIKCPRCKNNQLNAQSEILTFKNTNKNTK